VNPVIAVVIGYFLGGEALGTRTVAGTFLILVSVVVITTTPKQGSESMRNRIGPASAPEGRIS